MRSVVHLMVTVCAITGFACSNRDNDAPALEAIAPARVSALVRTPAAVSGRNLFAGVRVDLDQGEAHLDKGWSVAIGDTVLPGADVSWLDPTRLDVVLPAGLDVGLLDVTATGPSGERAVLNDGLEVTAEPIGLQLSIEDAPGGTGSAVGELSLTAGDELVLHAVARDGEGAFVTEVAVEWGQTAPLGELDAGPATSTTLRARAVGSGRVTAARPAAELSAQTGLLTVTTAAPAAIRIVDAPVDGGLEIGDRAGLTTDPDGGLVAYAVAVDAFDNFVGPEPVTWELIDVSGVLPGAPAQVATVDFATTGTGRLRATHASLTADETGLLTVGAGRAAALAVEPDTLSLSADDPAVQFGVDAVDADGNPTGDLGTLTWSVASGPIGDLDPSTGLFDPTAAGDGAIAVSSSHGATDQSGTITVLPGHAAMLSIAPTSLELNADDAAVTLVASGVDADGNPTTDLGTLTWSTVGVTQVDANTGLFDPQTAGTGSVHAASSYGPAAQIPATVDPGRAAALTVGPDTASLSADDAPITFTAAAVDGDGNPTSDLGTIAWSIASGPITSIDPATGAFTPNRAGTGTVRAASSHGAVDDSGAVTVTAGAAAEVVIRPDEAVISLNGSPLELAVDAVDGDGNPTTDVGVLTWSVASGNLATLDPSTGVLTPTAVSSGTVGVASSLGPIDVTGAITITGGIFITAVDLPTEVLRAERNARVEVDVQNSESVAVAFTGTWLQFEQGAVDRGADYTVVPDFRNPPTIAGSSTATLAFHVTVSPTAATGAVEVTAAIQGFAASIGVLTDSAKTGWTVVDAAPPTAVISAPVVPTNRICAGGTVNFAGAGSTPQPLTYFWDLFSGTPSFSTVANPAAVTYSSRGSFPYSLAVTTAAPLFRQDTAFGAVPIFVGNVEGASGSRYPTGPVQFSAPVPDQVIDMGTLPSGQYIDMDTALGLKQCDGTNVPSAGLKFLTVWSDRGAIDPGQDVRADLPGVQVALKNAGDLQNVSLLNDATQREGPALLYAEFRRPSDGVVTASGWVRFGMGNDQQQPTVPATTPPACDAACYGHDWRWVLQFSEPMSVTSMSNLRLESGTGTCSSGGSWTDISAESVIIHDPVSYTLTILPKSQSGTYPVRIKSNGTVRDASANGNPLTGSYTTCSVVTSLPPPAAPTLSAVSVAPNPMSVDGDGSTDGTTIEVTVNAATTAIWIEITHGDAVVARLFRPVTAAGTYSITWEGRDSAGRLVPDGNYLRRIWSENGLGVRSPISTGLLQVNSQIGFIGLPPRSFE